MADTKKLLVREKLRTPSFSKELKTLASTAQILLGYQGMAKVVRRGSRLVRVLKQLHIHPFTAKSVREYQDKVRLATIRKLNRELRQQRNVGWKRVEISHYIKPIPEFVLHKAIQIKQIEPEVNFLVEELNVSKIEPDPFLVASLDGEEHYIEVWEEPEFENEVLASAITEEDASGDDDSSDSSDEEGE